MCLELVRTRAFAALLSDEVFADVDLETVQVSTPPVAGVLTAKACVQSRGGVGVDAPLKRLAVENLKTRVLVLGWLFPTGSTKNRRSSEYTRGRSGSCPVEAGELATVVWQPLELGRSSGTKKKSGVFVL